MKTALLIEPDQFSRNSLAEWLREGGWAVLDAEEGRAGLALALERRPELVFCDLLTPDYNGFQICRALRAQRESGYHVKIIATGSGGYGADRRNALDAGADDYIVKPILRHDFFKFMLELEAAGRNGVLLTAPAEATAGQGRVTPRANPPDMVAPGQLTVRFWGVRGSIPTPGPSTQHYGGNTACIEVRADGEIIIMDAGSGIRPLGLRLAEEAQGRPLSLTLLISHTHWDHIQGFPFFAPAYNPKNQLRILGYEGAHAGLLTILSSQMESPYFPVGWKQLPSNIVLEEQKTLSFQIGAVECQAAPLNHPGICMGYRVNTSCGSVAYLPDNEPFQRYKYSSGAPSPPGSTEVIEYARRMDQKLVDFIQGVDVLIVDSQYDATEYQTRVGWGHGCLDDVVALAVHGNVKRLFLFHHDPGHDDIKISQMVGWSRDFVSALGEPMIVDAAREGLEVVLKAAPAG